MRLLKSSRAFFFAVLVLPAALALALASPKAPQVRVKIGDLASSVEISGQDLALASAGKIRRGDDFYVSWDGGNARIDGNKAALPITVSSGSFISVNGTAFRGIIRIVESSPPLVLDLLDLESYLAGVINQEIDSRWPAAAVDAQVILARTYALKKMKERSNEPFDLVSGVNDQVYGGIAAEDDLAWAAVNRTEGMVLTYNHELAAGLYHSCCGGRTAVPSEVWGGRDEPYQKSVECNYCQDAPRFFWRFPEKGAMSGKELASLLGFRDDVTDLVVTARTGSGRARTVIASAGLAAKELSGQEFRTRMGYERIWSAAFQPSREEGGFVFRGSGSGHGVGLCQWGARGMALAGFPSGKILGYYFPGITVESYERLGLN